MRKIAVTLAMFTTVSLVACSLDGKRTELTPNSRANILPVSRVEWTPLNKARGDASPQAATLLGNRAESVPTGFLVKFKDGFSSPPHIHNVSYRGVVIRGTVHNDDPEAGKQFMPVGSYWTQPAGQVHITAAAGKENVAYIEIPEGPYLVLPVEKAFDTGERPINVEASNVVWVDLPESIGSETEVKLAYLWQDVANPAKRGYFLKLPASFRGAIVARGSEFRAVVITGQPRYRSASTSEAPILDPGSLIESIGLSTHGVECAANSESIFYVHTDGNFEVVSNR